MISVGNVIDPWVHSELFSSTVKGQDMSHESWVLCFQMFRRVSITGSWISKLFGIFTVETFNFGMYPYTAEATPIYAATAQGRQGSFWAVQELPVHFLSCPVEWKCFMQESRMEFFETLSQHFFLSTFALVVSGRWSDRIFDLPVANAWGLTGGAQNVGNNDSTTTSARFTKIPACFSSRSIKKRSCCFFLKWLSLQDQGAPSVRVAQIIVQEFEGIGKNSFNSDSGCYKAAWISFSTCCASYVLKLSNFAWMEHTPIELEDCQWLSYIQGILEWEKFKLDQFWQWWPMSSWVAEATPRAASPPSWPLGVDNEITSDA